MANVIGTKVLLKGQWGNLKGIIVEVVHFAIPCEQSEECSCKESFRVKVQIHPCYPIWLSEEEYKDDLVEILEADDWWESYDPKTGQYLGYEKPMYK